MIRLVNQIETEKTIQINHIDLRKYAAAKMDSCEKKAQITRIQIRVDVAITL